MRIASYHPLSLSDFPPYCAAVIFTICCNLRCNYCHNKILWDENCKQINPDEVLNLLQRKKNLLDGVVITGGEPTIQKNLSSFAKKIKNMGYKIKLNTNGINTTCLQNLIEEKLIDYIALDIKSSFDFYREGNLENVKKSIDLIVSNKVPHEFRTVQDSKLSNNHDIDSIKNMLPKNSKRIIFPTKHSKTLY